MNDLNKTSRTGPASDGADPQRSPNDVWQMPEPIFKRSVGRVGTQRSGEVPKAPSTIVPDRLKKAEEQRSSPPPRVEAQPVVFEESEVDEMDFSDLRPAAAQKPKIPFWIVIIAVVALIGIASALAVAVVFGYIVSR